MKSLKKSAATQKPLTSTVVESANQIWLAGLGAFAKAQVEGGKIFEALVDAGRQIEDDGRRLAGDKVEKVAGKAVETWDKLETVFQDRVARSLSRLGVPSDSEIKSLTKRIDNLSKMVDQLLERDGIAKPAAKPATKAAVVKTEKAAKPAAAEKKPAAAKKPAAPKAPAAKKATAAAAPAAGAEDTKGA
ncbi:phasin family protein [Chitinivorax sp. PXF-14]|uniref:phasin family protein n=1 Tax=Chitinivorax sp. PXF-14 TaxID=3230488 RepID=UPI0034655DB5